jgi:hypothetical protein
MEVISNDIQVASPDEVTSFSHDCSNKWLMERKASNKSCLFLMDADEKYSFI